VHEQVVHSLDVFREESHGALFPLLVRVMELAQPRAGPAACRPTCVGTAGSWSADVRKSAAQNDATMLVVNAVNGC
jgi:hypothetical protein